MVAKKEHLLVLGKNIFSIEKPSIALALVQIKKNNG